ncbi:hypothetical protein GCM10028832_44180 [Streptomyces sparsus]
MQVVAGGLGGRGVGQRDLGVHRVAGVPGGGERPEDRPVVEPARRQPLIDLGLTDRRSGYPLEMVVRAADEGWRILETSVGYHPRTGRSKVTGTWRGTAQAVRDMRGVLR